MPLNPERLSQIFKSPAQCKIARDFLRRKLHEEWACNDMDEPLRSLAARGEDTAALASWCANSLSMEQIRTLQKALRLAANQQRVYKRTVMLSPRAHLLIKTLADQHGLTMSDVIELYLDPVLTEHFGLTLRTTLEEQSGLVEHEVVPIR